MAYAEQFAALGRLVIVEHGSGVSSLDGYLDEVAVALGAAIERGTPLGSSGRAPAGEGALYFELRIDGRPVDPLEWLKPAAARPPRHQGPPGP